MIDYIEISGCASYGTATQKMDDLKMVNYVYGPNGAGKTTLSRVIADTGNCSAAFVGWRGGTKLEPLVYNRDFVTANFDQKSDLKGIFTLGQKDIAAQNKIVKANNDVGDLTRTIENLNKILDGDDEEPGKREKLIEIENAFAEDCWKIKIKHDEKLKDALKGLRHAKQTFKERILEECAKEPLDPTPTAEDLYKRADSVFGPAQPSEALMPKLDDSKFLAWEADPVLKRRVLGKSDVDIASLIQKLGNSDWVRQGIDYFKNSNNVCPFCQQETPENLAAKLEEYFDETFEKESQAIAELQGGYRLAGERIQNTLDAAIESGSRFLESDKLRSEREIFDSRFQSNLRQVDAKAKEPSQIITLKPLGQVVDRAKQLLASADNEIQAHNAMVANLAIEQSKLKKQVWQFFAQVEIADAYKQYKADKQKILQTIKAIESKIKAKEEEKSGIEGEIRRLERSITSVQPTVEAINRLLQQFGFNNFSLQAAKGNRYRLVRSDGSDAKETLSEGERSFVTFLYFYHLLKGSENEEGMTRDRVAVFDDPVSSLDSDVLFVVSSLIRQTIQEASSQSGLIKQVFVFTHNVYFHKEITFFGNRAGEAAFAYETFWTVSKINGVSRITRHQENPIKNSYELLWSELRNPDLTNQNIQNSMRRILENYFRILGGIGHEQILGHFEGEEKLICRSLLSWIHEGSHSIPDDIFHTLDESTMQRYLAVFRMIFVRMRHLGHYNMMMGLPVSLESVSELE